MYNVLRTMSTHFQLSAHAEHSSSSVETCSSKPDSSTSVAPSLLTPATTDDTMPSEIDDKKQSWTSVYAQPPSVKYPYNSVEALCDIPAVSYALDLFLASHMLEAEEYCNKTDQNK